jgi:hypothetical protein
VTLTLTFTSQNGFQGPVSLSVLEGGQPVSWLSPNPVQRNLNVPRGQQVQETLQVQVAPNAPTGSRNLTVRAAYGNQVTERALTLTVNAPPSFTLSLNPTSLTVQQGGSGTTQLTITPQNGFTGTISLSLAGAPSVRDPLTHQRQRDGKRLSDPGPHPGGGFQRDPRKLRPAGEGGLGEPHQDGQPEPDGDGIGVAAGAAVGRAPPGPYAHGWAMTSSA